MRTKAQEGPIVRDRPLLNSHFLVDFGQGNPYDVSQGFAEVEFPVFQINSALDEVSPDAELDLNRPRSNHSSQRLILRRGVFGKLDLYTWWNKASRGKASPRRSLRVHLLADDQETIALTWTFRKVRPVSLSYSPLRAMEGAVLMETIELAFDRFEMS